jgi:hypothetical protein
LFEWIAKISEMMRLVRRNGERLRHGVCLIELIHHRGFRQNKEPNYGGVLFRVGHG